MDYKNTAPQDIANTLLPHTAYVLQREVARSQIDALRRTVKLRVKAEIRRTRRRLTERKSALSEQPDAG